MCSCSSPPQPTELGVHPPFGPIFSDRPIVHTRPNHRTNLRWLWFLPNPLFGDKPTPQRQTKHRWPTNKNIPPTSVQTLSSLFHNPVNLKLRVCRRRYGHWVYCSRVVGFIWDLAVEAWGWGGSFIASSWRFGRRRGLGWVRSWRQGFGLEFFLHLFVNINWRGWSCFISLVVLFV